MNRLTKRIDGTVIMNADYDATVESIKAGGSHWRNSIENCMEQLANYEDTGLTPDDARWLIHQIPDSLSRQLQERMNRGGHS